MSVVEGCQLTQILFKKFGYLERRVTYLEGKSRDQQEVIEELQTKSRSQENIIHELQSELKNKTATRNQEDDSSEEEFEESVDVDVTPDLNELTEPIQNAQLIIAEKDDKLNQRLVVQLGTRYSEKPQRLENTFENSPEVEKDPKSKISQKNKTKSARQEVKTGGKSSRSKRKGKKSHICLFCSKSCQTFSDLSDHMRVHTRERPFECKICSKSFTQLGTLKMHTRVHTGERPFSCSVCSKSFTRKQEWTRHMMVHTGEKPVPCSVCPKRYANNSALNRHMRSHSGVKPYSCSLCPKRYADNADLKSHMRLHSGEKPYSCLVISCPMAFTSSAGLRYHMSMHFGTYSCPICSKRFGQKYFLKIHEREHTAGEKL